MCRTFPFTEECMQTSSEDRDGERAGSGSGRGSDAFPSHEPEGRVSRCWPDALCVTERGGGSEPRSVAAPSSLIMAASRLTCDARCCRPRAALNLSGALAN